MKEISVLIAEDHTVVREGLFKMLELDGDIKVIGEAENGRQAVAMAVKLRPAVVLMDIAMPLLNGLEATRQLLIAIPDLKVLILSAHSDEAYIEGAIDSGAAGMLLKQTSSRDVCHAIREVQKGNTFFSPSIAKEIRERGREARNGHGPSKSRWSHLTSREVEVLQLIAEGKTNKEAAGLLGISIKTVEKHRQNLMGKLKIHDTAGLTRHAISAGIVENSIQVTVTKD